MSKEINLQYVIFQIGDEEYGVDIMLVQEIVRYQKLTTVFNANPAIRGIMNFRGKIIPVIDMRRKFNLPEIEYDPYAVVIIIEFAQKTMGLVVERVLDIVELGQQQIQAIDQEFAEDIMAEHIDAMANFEQRIIMLIDPKRVMSFEEYRMIKEVVEYGESEGHTVHNELDEQTKLERAIE